jgi:thiosulfate dehydrogenase [quinone] large subunit
MSDNHSIMATTNLSSVDRWLAYAVFRFTLGINILIHGVDRVFGAGARGFAAKTSGEFAGTALPHVLVYAFLIFLPFAEVVLGALMIFGLLTRWTLTLGGLLIAVLVFGTALRSDWSTAGVQMVYAITYYFLLKNLADNYFSVDTLLPAYRKPLTIGSTALSGDRE